MSAEGFEPSPNKWMRPERTALDHSAKLTVTKVLYKKSLRYDRYGSCVAMLRGEFLRKVKIWNFEILEIFNFETFQKFLKFQNFFKIFNNKILDFWFLMNFHTSCINLIKFCMKCLIHHMLIYSLNSWAFLHIDSCSIQIKAYPTPKPHK